MTTKRQLRALIKEGHEREVRLRKRLELQPVAVIVQDRRGWYRWKVRNGDVTLAHSPRSWPLKTEAVQAATQLGFVVASSRDTVGD